MIAAHGYRQPSTMAGSGIPMSYDDILAFCKSQPTPLIYLSIGCSQRFYPQGGGSAQQFPPFVASWPGRRVCILIDPDLEESPRGIVDAGKPAQPLHDGQIADFGDVAFVTRRRPWGWPYHPNNDERIGSAQFLDGLCRLATAIGGPHLIVQDYSGPDIRRFYPVAEHGVQLLNRVMFDVTGMDGGCFVDFSKVHIRRDERGNFIQPAFTPLWKLRALHHPALAHEAADRAATLLNYVGRLYRAHRLLDPPRDWYAPESGEKRVQTMTWAYGLQPGTNTKDLLSLFHAGIFDLCATAEHFVSEGEVLALLEGPFDQVRTSLTLLRDVIIADADAAENSKHPTS